MRDIRSIKAAVFDLDGTLLDSTAAWEGLGERYLAGRGITPEPGLDEKLRCMTLPDGSAYLKSAYSLPEPPDKILRDILRGIEEFYLAECPLKPGAQELLGLLSRRGVGISAATAGDERLAHAALERLGVLGYFSALLTCEGYGGKDKPDIFLNAAAAAGGIPENTAVFEDSLHALLTAKQAGFLAVGVYDPGEPQQEKLKASADYYFRSMSDCSGLFLAIPGYSLSFNSASAMQSPRSSPE